MPENQTQTGQGPKASEVNRPSDTEAAHAPQEGKTFSDAEGRIEPPRQDGKDRREDYGGGSMGHSRPGTDERTAGAEFADRLPEAAATPAVDGETGKKSPTS